MKTTTIAAIFAVATVFATAPAMADVVGSVEYSVENETLETSTGVEFALAEAVTVTALANLETTDFSDVEFTGSDLQVHWTATDEIVVYGNVELDGDLDYTDTQVGVSFRF